MGIYPNRVCRLILSASFFRASRVKPLASAKAASIGARHAVAAQHVKADIFERVAQLTPEPRQVSMSAGK